VNHVLKPLSRQDYFSGLSDLARDAERAIDGVPGRIVANWVEGRL
jgi:hypothetical protein